jgi:small-conductance mechanosensitive channel
MAGIRGRMGHGLLDSQDNRAVERRIYLFLKWVVAIAVVVSAIFAPWRITSGLLLGGLLSILNLKWLRRSIAAMFATSESRPVPRLSIWRYILRYFVIAIVVLVAFSLDLVSLPATIVGLSLLVVAFFLEAFIQFYYAIVHRED